MSFIFTRGKSVLRLFAIPIHGFVSISMNFFSCSAMDCHSAIPGRLLHCYLFTVLLLNLLDAVGIVPGCVVRVLETRWRPWGEPLLSSEYFYRIASAKDHWPKLSTETTVLTGAHTKTESFRNYALVFVGNALTVKLGPQCMYSCVLFKPWSNEVSFHLLIPHLYWANLRIWRYAIYNSVRVQFKIVHLP